MLSAQRRLVLPFFSNRLFSSNSVIEPLSNRTLIQVNGSQVFEYLQGLITNDISHLNAPNKSMFAMFLNTKGRILYDTIIYRNNTDNSFLIECDKQIAKNLEKLLKLYRVKRKIDVIQKDELDLHVAFNIDKTQPKLENQICDNYEMYRDPRIPQLGFRIISKTSRDQLEKDLALVPNATKTNYRWLRYSFGVGEGIADLPPGECFPLECNCDYLHGVSFHKGCYIGQELTARVHHTGVVRKRLMPIYFTKTPTQTPPESIIHENVNLGKLRGIEHNAGLGLIRFEKALKFTEIQIGDGLATTSKPFWWPSEAPKEQANKIQQ